MHVKKMRASDLWFVSGRAHTVPWGDMYGSNTLVVDDDYLYVMFNTKGLYLFITKFNKATMNIE